MKTKLENIATIKKSEVLPNVGDIFSFKLISNSERHFFGRVISVDAKLGWGEEVMLIYLYKKYSLDVKNIPLLQTSDLLVPPIGVNLTPWKSGVFEFVKNSDLNPSDMLEKHCFVSFNGRYYDEYGNRMYEPIEPIGYFSIVGVGGVDRIIGENIGLLTAS